MATAETGEFPLQVSGLVVHRGWEVQGQLQDASSGTPTKSVSRAAGRYEVEIRKANGRWRHNNQKRKIVVSEDRRWTASLAYTTYRRRSTRPIETRWEAFVGKRP
jgi:hypothetical protein